MKNRKIEGEKEPLNPDLPKPKKKETAPEKPQPEKQARPNPERTPEYNRYDEKKYFNK